jgi:hypothetical protein
VLVNDRGVDVGHFGPFGQPVDHKRVERGGVRNGDMEEEVVATGDDEDADGFGELVRPVAESLDVLARRRTDADGDQRVE